MTVFSGHSTGRTRARTSCERDVRVGVVRRNAEHPYAQASQVRETVVELARLLGAARRVVGRIEVERRLSEPVKSASDGLLPRWSFNVKAGALSSERESYAMHAP